MLTHSKDEVQMASGSIWNSVASGEGFMAHFTGPGRVWIQTHKKPLPTNAKGEVVQQANPLVCLAVFGCFLLVFLGIASLIILAIFFGEGGDGPGPMKVQWASGEL